MVAHSVGRGCHDGKTGRRENEHPLVRACLGKVGIDGGVSIEIESDVGDRGTGLGSSSALVVGLLNALVAYKSGVTPSLFGLQNMGHIFCRFNL